MILRNKGKAPVRPRVAVISLLAGTLGACAISTSRPPQLGYAPPDADPAEPGLGYVAQPADLIWNQLLDRVIQSSLEVDLADPGRGIVVASYSGEPEPYVTCGWILLDRGGEPEQVAASGEASFTRVVEGRRLEVNRGLKLDARLVVEVKPDGDGARVETASNYVLTKTVVAENRLGWARGGAREVISFSAGERGEFSKGTVCQPNGALERVVLDIVPPVSEAGLAASDGPAATRPPAPGAGPAQSTPTAASRRSAPTIRMAEVREPSAEMADASEQAAGAPPAESAGPGPATAEEQANVGAAATAQPEVPSPEILGIPNREDPEALLECPIDDRIFCEVLDLTDPYRRANQERDLGLAVDAMEDDNPLVIGSGLGLDISLPNYDAYLSVSYFLKDGTVHHVLSGSNRRWPANAREFVSDAGLSTDDRRLVEMVVALASDVPVFSSPRPAAETAELYLSALRARLSEISNGGSPAQIAASLIVVTPA